MATEESKTSCMKQTLEGKEFIMYPANITNASIAFIKKRNEYLLNLEETYERNMKE